MIKVTTTKSAAGQLLQSPQDIYVNTETVVTKTGMVTTSKQSTTQDNFQYIDLIGLKQDTLINSNPTLPVFSALQNTGESNFKDYLVSLNISGVTAIVIV